MCKLLILLNFFSEGSFKPKFKLNYFLFDRHSGGSHTWENLTFVEDSGMVCGEWGTHSKVEV